MFNRSRGQAVVVGLATVGALALAGTAGAGTTVPPDDTTAEASGGSTAPDAPPFEIGEVAEDMTVVYVPGLTGNPFYNTVACGAEQRAEELGIEFIYQGAPTFDVALQSGIVSALIGEEPDAIMISVTDPDAMKSNYVPDTQNVLASTPLVNPGETFELRFTAPATPGRYPYVCTFPGHWRLMQGTLVVTP